MASVKSFTLSCLFIFSLFSQTMAISSGLLGFCDLTPLSQYGKGTSIMKWVQTAQTNTTFYTLRSGDGIPSSDPTSYVPDALNPIHIRVSDLDKKFIGLLMYAVVSSTIGKNTTEETKVGTWTIPAGYQFQTPPSLGCENAVTHLGADLKPLHTRFFWSAPKGTGQVTFRIMIKQGEQNKGNFYVPLKVLVLNEGNPLPTAPKQSVLLGAVGVSCDSTCATQSVAKYCDHSATINLNNPSALDVIAQRIAPCRYPLLSGCSAEAPLQDADGYCWFKSSTCGVDNRTTAPTTCDSLSNDTGRFCACTDDISATMNTATSIRGSSILPTIFSLFTLLFASHSRSSLGVLAFVLVLLAQAMPCMGHNWVNTPSRALIASVAQPCQARINPNPHVQVASNQKFELEWSTGHGDSNTKFAYFVVVHSSDYLRLKELNTSVMDRYLAAAPVNKLLNATKDRKVHLAPPLTSEAYTPGYYDSVPTPNTSALYIPRDPVNVGKSGSGGMNAKSVQYSLYDQFVSKDRRAAYVNSNWTWIESIHKFEIPYQNSTTFAHHADLATFTIEGRKGKGDYIVWFYWGGYRDCVDVNLVATTVTNRYGILNSSAPASYVKIDHCEFTFIPRPTTACTIIPSGNAQTCLTACKNSYCTGVQVVRAKNPSITLPYPVNIPYSSQNGSQVVPNTFPPQISGPCGYYDVKSRVNAGCKEVTPLCNATKLNAKPTDFICYSLVPYRDQDFQVAEDYQLTDDPLDPKFYSTCWLKIDAGGFLNPPVIKTPLPDWNVGDQCISCDFQQAVVALNSSTAPDWEKGLTTECISCDRQEL